MEVDFVQAAAYLKQAADLGHAQAQYTLETLLLEPCCRTPTRAMQLYEQSASQGYGKALFALAKLYAED